MKVTCKTVQGKAFQLEAEPTDKVSDIKNRINEVQGFPAANQVLIHKGKVLADDGTLESNDVTEASFLVVMVTKPKAQPVAAAAPAAAAPAAPAEPAPPAPQPVPEPASAPAAAPAATPTPAPAGEAAEAAPAAAGAAGGASELLVGSALEERISMIVEMGFPREDVIKAMRAAFNNSERAVEYLMTGIPASAEPMGGAPAPVAAGAGGAPAAGTGAAAAPAGGLAAGAQPLDMFGGVAGAGAGGGAAARGGLGGGSLDFLRDNPQFHMLRNMVQANPQILQPMLQELAKSNPQLLAMINSNQSDFLRLLGEAGGEGGEGLAAQLGELAGGMDMEGGLPPGMVQIQLTPEEAEAVGRLEGLGFPRDLCLEAFLACDKNEEMAANYLFENGADDMQ